ncbi:hypothetical protein Scep_023084 [Stephania cephalantha]|uniref:PB1 domain-containing protein n=1 Tax=Stephania cephalantha TaxID=152367 RepID=A0AAP0F6M9_9MAGN
MDPPLSAAAAAATTESVESSPRSRHAESWVDEALPQVPGGGKLRLMCSYGGHIFPRPHDKSLCYIGGDTRMVVVERHTSLVDLSLRLSRTVLNGRPFTLKYQLPDEDLDSLISVTTDEDLDNMIEEYDRTSSLAKSSRLRLFLFPTKMETATSLGTLIEDSAKSVSWFVEALNGSSSSSSGGYHLPMMRGVSADSGSVNCLLGLGLGLGLDDDKSSSSVGQIGEESGGGQMIGENKRVVMTNTNNKNNSTAADLPNTNTNTNTNSNNHINQDVHSMPDSPMLETSSSFGSTSSSPSMANLPPIRVHVEDHLHHPHHHKQQQQLIGGLDESFAQMSVSTVPTTATTSVSVTVVGHKQQQQQQQQQDDGGAFLLLSSPPPPLPTNIGVVNSNNAFVVSDDERSDHGVPTAFRKPPSPHQMLHRSAELPSPDDSTMSR